MKLGRIHRTGKRKSASANADVLVIEVVILEDTDMFQNGTNDQTATAVINYLVNERAADKQTITNLQTQLANSNPTDADNNAAIAGLDTTLKTKVPADVLAAATAASATPAPATPPADGTAPVTQPGA